MIKGTKVVEPTLKESQRCDRCPSRACVQAVMKNGELLFCKHHYEKHEAALSAQALAITDERDLLVGAQ